MIKVMEKFLYEEQLNNVDSLFWEQMNQTYGQGP